MYATKDTLATTKSAHAKLQHLADKIRTVGRQYKDKYMRSMERQTELERKMQMLQDELDQVGERMYDRENEVIYNRRKTTLSLLSAI